MLSATGFGFALINGIPLRLGAINNDGCNARELGKDPEALRSLWVQLKITEQAARVTLDGEDMSLDEASLATTGSGG